MRLPKIWFSKHAYGDRLVALLDEHKVKAKYIDDKDGLSWCEVTIPKAWDMYKVKAFIDDIESACSSGD